MSSSNPTAVSGGSAVTNPLLSTVNWGSYWDTPGTSQAVIYYYVAGNEFINFSDAGSPYVTGSITVDANTPTSAEMAAVNLAMQLFENVANIDFVATSNYSQADLVWVISATEPSYAYGVSAPPAEFYNVQISDYQSGVLVNSSYYEGGSSGAGLAQGGFDFITFIHELGHAVGLAHPHDNGGNSTIMAGVTSAFGDYGDYNLNQGIFSMMSYNDGWTTGLGINTSFTTGYEATPMALDVAWLQAVYGANTSFHSGSDTYTLGHAGSADYLSCIWDTGGTDTLNYAGAYACTIDLRAATLASSDGGAGYVSFVNGAPGSAADHWNAFTIAAGAVIENASGGSGNDVLTGNDAANVLSGGDGNDALTGGAGNDTLIGGAGNDTLAGGDGSDTADYSAATGAITLNLSVLTQQNTGAAGFDTLSGIENAKGGSGNDALTGSDSNNTLEGGDGDDVLSGGAGSDKLFGGLGNDTLDGGAGDDLLNGGGGVNTADYGSSSAAVTVNLSITVQQNTGAGGLDTLVSIANVKGGTGSDTLTGNDAANILSGGAGNDTLDGGAGKDTLNGNDGADTLTGGAGDDTLDGGAGNDILLGGAGNDTLIGGAGKDDMTGGAGDDLYIVNVALDRVFEDAAGGTDSVRSVVAWTLGANVENLSLTGTANIDGTGNSSVNFIAGNAGNNVLNGLQGSDRLTGGDGADVFVFSSALGTSNVDRVTDFSHIADSIRLDDAIFSALAQGQLDADAFYVIGSGLARDAEDRILYNNATGALSYDADGSGSQAAVTFAILTGIPLDVSADDFFIV